jgi:site-specific DNA-methyltransferase (adenine-specific)
MEYMATVPDKYFDLAIVDPPYGLPKDAVHGRGKLKTRAINSMNMKWDVAPNMEYFSELWRVSKNQIIWGGNYFNLPACRCFICWDKVQPWENFSQVEYAWTSFGRPAKLYRYDNRTGDKIHPTQKPVQLYKWTLRDFSLSNFKIIDTHLGSGSSAIAAYDFGVSEFVGCEIDKEYYEAALKRFEIHKMQQKLF